MAERGEVRTGDEARDEITGFRGVVVAVTTWLNGCERVTIQPKKLHEGKPVETQTFDVEQLVVVKPSGRAALRATGGDRPNVKRAADPAR